MRDERLTAVSIAYVISALVALWGREHSKDDLRWWVFKLLTTSMLFLILWLPERRLWMPDTPFRRWVALALVFSLLGDAGLLWKPTESAGVGMFLLAQVCYVVAFCHVARPSVPAAFAAAVFVAASALLVFRSWDESWHEVSKLPALGPTVLVVYALALTAMVITAAASTGERPALPGYVALGAALFYVGDASIALDTFVYKASGGIPHSWWLTSGVYWVGQILIVWGARVGPR